MRAGLAAQDGFEFDIIFRGNQIKVMGMATALFEIELPLVFVTFLDEPGE